MTWKRAGVVLMAVGMASGISLANTCSIEWTCYKGCLACRLKKASYKIGSADAYRFGGIEQTETRYCKKRSEKPIALVYGN
jgi:hypothetical protein